MKTTPSLIGLIAGAVLCPLAATTLFAADMPARMPLKASPAVPVDSWTGFYLGGHVGGIWGGAKDSWENLGPNVVAPAGVPALLAVSNTTQHSSSAMGGAQFGFNYQSGSVVTGLEADISALKLSASRTGSLTNVGNFAAGAFLTESFSSTYLATFRGRVGYAPANWLLYITGGLAVARVTYTDFLNYNNAGFTQGAQDSGVRTGWTVGGGTEYAFSRNWSAKAEFLYADLGTSSASSGLTSFPTNITHQHRLTEEVARLGLNYRFH